MPRGKPHSQETKAAVMAALLTGAGVEEIAREYELPPATVYQWRKQMGPEVQKKFDEKKVADLGALVADYLVENLTTLTAQVRYFRTEEWLAKQDASEVAVLHGVITDKAIRILGALEPTPEAE